MRSPYSKNPVILMVNRDKEFAPLKNGPDAKENNPATCKRALEANGELKTDRHLRRSSSSLTSITNKGNT